MRIFLTGATGHIGSAVLEALLRAGHQVTALVRDNEKAARVAARGAYPVVGNLADPESYRPAADAQDGYIHTAFDRSGKGVAIDRQAIEALLGAARRPRTSRASGTPRFFIYTSGVWVIGRAPQPVDESAPLAPIALAQWRVAHDELVLSANDAQLRTAVVRPGVVYGGAQGMVGDLFKMASNGLVRVIGDGNNHWPLIYDRDLADLYLKIAGNEAASGVFIANDEGDDTVNDIVIADNCRSVDLRAERQNNGNGRVYTITFRLRDTSGNTTTGTAKVYAPKNEGETPGNDGAHYSVSGNCR